MIFKSIFYSQIVCTVVRKKVFRQKYFVTCGCNRVHLPSPYSDGGADCHSKKTRPGANIFFISSPLSLFVVQGISRYHTIFRPLLLCKKSNNGYACLLSSGGLFSHGLYNSAHLKSSAGKTLGYNFF